MAVTCPGHLLRSRLSVCHCRAPRHPTARRGERRRGRVWGKEAGFGVKRHAGFPSRDRSGRPILLSNPLPSQRETAPFLLSQGHRRLFAESRSRGLFSLSHAPSCPGLIPWAKVLASGGAEAATPWGPARTDWLTSESWQSQASLPLLPQVLSLSSSVSPIWKRIFLSSLPQARGLHQIVEQGGVDTAIPIRGTTVKPPA